MPGVIFRCCAPARCPRAAVWQLNSAFRSMYHGQLAKLSIKTLGERTADRFYGVYLTDFAGHSLATKFGNLPKSFSRRTV